MLKLVIYVRKMWSAMSLLLIFNKKLSSRLDSSFCQNKTRALSLPIVLLCSNAMVSLLLHCSQSPFSDCQIVYNVFQITS